MAMFMLPSEAKVGIPYFCVWKMGRLRKTSLIR